jgi:KDO2-lipid IV(A) lauroyltransferase
MCLFVKEFYATFLISLFVKILLVFSRKARSKFLKRVGKLMFKCSKKARKRAINNISNALPTLSRVEVKRTAYESYANCAFGAVESFWLDQLEPDIFCDEGTLKILQSGEGACIATMHLGCYEAVPLAVEKLSGKSVTLTNIPNFIRNGKQFYTKANIVAVNKNDSDAFAQLLKQTCSNAYISLHSDLYVNQIELDFFNQKVKAPAGVAMLAKMTKKPLLLAYAVYQDNGEIRVYFETIIANHDKLSSTISQQPAEKIMSQIYQRFEEIIQEYPEQWHWSYNRWRINKR